MNDKLQTFSLNFFKICKQRRSSFEGRNSWRLLRLNDWLRIFPRKYQPIRDIQISVFLRHRHELLGWISDVWLERVQSMTRSIKSNCFTVVYVFLCLLSICWWPPSSCLYQSNLFLFVFSLTVRERESMLVWMRITMDPMMANPRTWTICLVTLWVGRGRAGEWQIHMSWSGGNAIHFYNVKVTQPIFLI